MKPFGRKLATAVMATMLAGGGMPALAASDGDGSSKTTGQEISEAMQAFGDYTARQRDQALDAAGDMMADLDAAIDRQEQALRENWASMSEAAREQSSAALEALRRQRNRLGEWYGALEHGADEAWSDVKSGFATAYNDLADSIDAAEEPKSEPKKK